MRSLRSQLILSHVLPLLAIIPLSGLVLIYILESQLLLPSLAVEVRSQASLLAELAVNDPTVWTSSAEASTFVARTAPSVTARVMLLDARGRLLASSSPGNSARVGTVIESEGLQAALAGSSQERTSPGASPEAEVIDVLAPVKGRDGRVVGVVRLTHQLTTVYGWFLRLRYIIAAVLGVGVVVGTLLGSYLAVRLGRPLQETTLAVSELASGRTPERIPERGPKEIGILVTGFNSLVDRLKDLEESRRQLLANLVHELGRPIGALLSATQALERGAAEDEVMRSHLVGGMEAELVRLQGLLDNLARLHEHLLGVREPVHVPVDLDDWILRTLAPWEAAAAEKGISFDASVPPDLPAATMDPDGMAQALGNLLSNAIKYTPAGGRIDIDAGADGATAWVRVEDSGPGIPPEYRERVFAPFYRGTGRSRFPQGMGLGLTIARDLVAAQGGSIELESEPGNGSRFTLRFPLRPVPQDQASRAST